MYRGFFCSQIYFFRYFLFYFQNFMYICTRYETNRDNTIHKGGAEECSF